MFFFWHNMYYITPVNTAYIFCSALLFKTVYIAWTVWSLTEGWGRGGSSQSLFLTVVVVDDKNVLCQYKKRIGACGMANTQCTILYVSKNMNTPESWPLAVCCAFLSRISLLIPNFLSYRLIHWLICQLFIGWFQNFN